MGEAEKKIDQGEKKSETPRKIIIASLKKSLIEALWEKKFKKAVQGLWFIDTATPQRFQVNLYEDQNVDETTLPQDINWIPIKYSKMVKTFFLKKDRKSSKSPDSGFF